ncbi:gp017L [Rabbit fibroma virus]|uniref:Gp017L n=1 Tax=Rabbit fibroma virus (strain Kasza) TaxID=10272 RepID=Q9Q953_RFVKA|nr:gp017L [Rabbit fibroma virus]AAF17901.1 gp017L [Rabbit fibroma virus]
MASVVATIREKMIKCKLRFDTFISYLVKKRNKSVNILLDDHVSVLSDDSDYYESGDSEYYESSDSAYESESEVPLLN